MREGHIRSRPLASIGSEREPELRWIAICCAVFLLFAMIMPNFLARTSWASGKTNRGTTIIDSPASFVMWLSLYGLIACVALAVGFWRRRWVVVATTIVASVAFAGAMYVIVSYWLDFSRGVTVLDGHLVTEMKPPRWTVRWPPLLPLFALAAVIGAVSALMLAFSWLRQPQAPKP